MKLAIIGSRDFNDFEMALAAFQQHFPNGDIDEIVSGGARGADAIGKAIAGHLGLKYTEFLPDWKTYGKVAGFMRNGLIIGHADVVLAFWDGKSRGTKDSLDIAKKQGKKSVIVKFTLKHELQSISG